MPCVPEWQARLRQHIECKHRFIRWCQIMMAGALRYRPAYVINGGNNTIRMRMLYRQIPDRVKMHSDKQYDDNWRTNAPKIIKLPIIPCFNFQTIR